MVIWRTAAMDVAPKTTMDLDLALSNHLKSPADGGSNLPVISSYNIP